MSHFCGLVIMTPEYLENHDLEDALSKYDENLEVSEYSRGEVSDLDKIEFLTYYIDYLNGIEIKREFGESLGQSFVGEDEERQINNFIYKNKDEYVKWWLEKFPEEITKFGDLYDKHGDDWNGKYWRFNYMSGKWEEYSTYNKNAVYDWYEVGGRWDSSIKTKSNEFVNDCFLNEIDWTDFSPEDYEEEEKEDWDGSKYKPLKKGVRWHFTKSSLPYCLFVDGEYISKGKMGWWGISSDEKKDWDKIFFEILARVPENSEVSLVDFHI